MSETQIAPASLVTHAALKVQPSKLSADDASDFADTVKDWAEQQIKLPAAPDFAFTLDIDDVVDHPERYGFVWSYRGAVGRAKEQNVLPLSPYVVVTDFAKFTASFGWGYISEGLTGSNSPRQASADRLASRAAERKSKAERAIFVDNMRDLKRDVVKVDLCGEGVKRNAPKWDGADGVTYFDTLSMAQADVAYFVGMATKWGVPEAQRMAVAKAQTVERLTALGIDPASVPGLVTK